MAKNTGRGLRSGTPSERSNHNPLTSLWTRRNSSSGKFMCQPRRGLEPRRSRIRAWLIGYGSVIDLSGWATLRAARSLRGSFRPPRQENRRR